MSEKRSLTDDQIRTVHRLAKAKLPETLRTVRRAMNEAQKAGEYTVSVPLASMKQIVGHLTLALGSAAPVRPFDLDPNDPIGFDLDPNDPVPGVDQDPTDEPEWDLDSTDP